ncbi:MAG: hypothetical protein QM530_01155 [Phycisphaerales bacterium]|nr:hypothetical protein [Phycisphaerales bacterium]
MNQHYKRKFEVLLENDSTKKYIGEEETKNLLPLIAIHEIYVSCGKMAEECS